MNKRYIPVTVITVLLFTLAAVGYLVPAQSDEPPVRVLFNNKGGKVIFAHETHFLENEPDCASCHHQEAEADTPISCQKCHVRQFNDLFIANHPDEFDETYCIACHHPPATIDKFNHDVHANDYAGEDCQFCHHDWRIEPEPQKCANCHKEFDDGDVINLRDASHARCADCHQDVYDQGSQGCGYCHVRLEAKPEEVETIACVECHEEATDQLIPTTTRAFHGQCQGCHEERQAGPYGEEGCFRCHMN